MKIILPIGGHLSATWRTVEAHQKISAHTRAAAEYDGWIQVLRANPEARLKLTQDDWLYFFGKV